MKEELLLFASRWDRAMERNDPAEIASFMHQDWICIGSTGPTNREDFIAMISSGDLPEMTTVEPRVKFYDNTGILTSRGISAGTWKGEPFRLDEWQTSVFLKEDDKWSCVITMLTSASESAAT